MTEPEPTLAYALDSQWHVRLLDLGFRPGVKTPNRYLSLRRGDWLIAAACNLGHPIVSFTLWNLKYCIPGRTGAAHVSLQHAYYMAVRLMEIVDEAPSYNTPERVAAAANMVEANGR